MANGLYLAGQLKTPTSTRKERETHDRAVGDVEQLTAKKVNRTIDFSEPRDTISPVSETDALPSPSTLLSPSGIREAGIVVTDPMSGFDREGSPCRQEKVRRFVALRESLEGAWKELGAWEVGGKTAKGVYRGVEVLDLTGG